MKHFLIKLQFKFYFGMPALNPILEFDWKIEEK